MLPVSRSRRALPAMLLVFVLSLGTIAPATSQDEDPLQVVASFSVLSEIVRQVGDDHVEVTSLVPAGGDAHTFDPSPDQVRTLEQADLIVSAGDDFEPWLDNLLQNVGGDTPHLEAFVASLDHDLDEHDTDENAAYAHDDEDADHEAGDDGDNHQHDSALHRWLDVHATIHMVDHLTETLTQLDPDNADAYQANGDAYITELEALDAYIVDQTATIPEDQRNLITVHQSMDAFANAYGYTIPGVLLESHSTEAADAPAGHIAELIGIIDKFDIPALFPDTPGGADLLEPVASEAGVEIAPQLYIDTLGTEGEGPESYVDMMRHNIDVITTALTA